MRLVGYGVSLMVDRGRACWRTVRCNSIQQVIVSHQQGSGQCKGEHRSTSYPGIDTRLAGQEGQRIDET